jgi:uncharacterized protein with FMN-binding domain
MNGIFRRIPALVCALVLIGLAACSTNPGSSRRTAVADGVYSTEGIGKSPTTPISVRTTFVNNTLVDISIGANQETGPILDSARTLLLPRIIQNQSIGVDSIAGATLSSRGILEAVEAAIVKAGGDADEWRTAPPRNNRLVKLTGYDVIVVGLGGAGMTAYLSAAEGGARVYGIEVGGKVGGNSATAGGPMAINSEYIKDLYYNGADYANRNALLKQWYADMEADVPANEIPAVDRSFAPAPPDVVTRTPAYAGGPKWQLIKTLIDESGKTVTWLARNYRFHFERASALSYPQYAIVTNYGNGEWDKGGGMGFFGPTLPGYTSDDFDDLYKTGMFTRAIEKAKLLNPVNDYKLELRATELIMDTNGNVAGVKATYQDGTKYEIYGKAVILATGGFIANPIMMNEYYGSALKAEAVHTERGDGVSMALKAGAGTYNISMPAMVHIGYIKNIIQNTGVPLSDRVALNNLLVKSDNLVVGLKTADYGQDLKGKRFSNEAAGMADGVAFENWRVGGYYAAIYSDDIFEEYKTSGMAYTGGGYLGVLDQGAYTPGTPVPNLDDILAMGEQYGNVVRGTSLADLAQKLELDADVLTATVNRYNTDIDNGIDSEYGKHAVVNMFGPPGSPPVNYLRKPDGVTPIARINPAASGYTAILGAGYYYGTTGGLDVDNDIRVLNVSREPIPGLYAVGQDSMGVLFNYRKAYVGYGAAAQAWAITSGRLAGTNAAAYAASK